MPTSDPVPGPDPRPLPDAARMQALLFDAAREGRADMIEALLTYGADHAAYDEKGHTALILAAYNGRAEAVAMLLARGAEVDAGDMARGNTALMGVAFKGHDEVAECLIAAGCAVDARNLADQTALMMATMFDRVAQVDLLLAHGADPAATDAAGNSAFSIAAAQGNERMADRLAGKQPA